MQSFEELLFIEAHEVINIRDIFDMGWQVNPQYSPFIYKLVPKKFGGGRVSAVMISSLVSLTWAFPLMHLYMYISVDKK